MRSLGVASTQTLALPGAPDALEACASPDQLLRLLRDYFAVAERAAAGLVRVRWGAEGPRITLLWPPLTLIAMGRAAYECGSERCAVSVDVCGGWLVQPGSTPRLAISVTRRADNLAASVELIDYAPRWVRWAAVRWLYLHAQAPIHARVGLAYLRQLQRRWQARPLALETAGWPAR
jgi:hypothetical protein